MPIEIRELHIKAVVSNPSRQVNTQAVELDLSKLKQEIIKECTKEVMQKLKEKNER